MSDFNNMVDYTGADSVKKKSKGVMVGIGALVLVGVSLVAYTFVPQVKNTVRLATQSPSQYLQTVTRDNGVKLASAVAKQYSQQLDRYDFDDGLAYDYNVSVQFSDELVEKVFDEYYPDATIPDTFVKQYSLNGTVNTKDGRSRVDVNVLANQDTLITANATVSNEDQMVYLQVPELSDAYLTIDADEDDFSNNMLEQESLKAITMEDVISAVELEQTIVKYTNIVVDNLTGDTTLEKGVKGSVLSVDYKYNKLSTKVTEDDVLELGNQLAEALKGDEVVMEWFTNGSNVTEEDYDEAIDSFVEDLEYIASGDDYLVLNTYVNSMGIICGFELTDDYDTISLMYANSGSNYAVQWSNSEVGSLDCTATKKSDGSFDGVLTYDTEEINVPIEFTGLTADGSNLEGKFTIALAPFDVSDYKAVSVDVATSDDSQSLTFTLDDQLTVAASVDFKGAEEVSLPTENLYDDSYEYWLTLNDTEELVDDWLTKVGLYDWYQDELNSLSESYGDFESSLSNTEVDDVYSDYDYLEDLEGDQDYAYSEGDDDEWYSYFDFNYLEMSYESQEFSILGEPTEAMLALESGEETDSSYYGSNPKYYTDGDSVYIVASDEGIESVQVVGGNGISEKVPNFSVNGVGVGSTYKDVNDAFECVAEDSTTSISIYDIYSDYIIEFYLLDGTVYGIFIW